MIVEVLFVFVVVLFICSWVLRSKNNNLPPGPLGIPFIGSLPHLRLEDCQKEREKYGDMFIRKFGNGIFLYITDYKLSKEAFNKIEFADRPHWEFLRLFEEEKKQGHTNGIAMNNGHNWQMNRRFLLQHLRDLGMGKSKIEGIILREIECLVEEFKTLTSEPSSLPFAINVCVLNVIWQLVASKRYDFSDDSVRDFMDTIRDVQGSFGAIGILEHFPVFKSILPKSLLHYLFKSDRFPTAARKFKELVQGVIDDHVEKLDVENPADLIDDYLSEMKKSDSEKFSHFCHNDLVRITFDLFVAGNETTSSMVHWVLIYLANYQVIQKKLHGLIDEFVPPERIPGLEQREKLGYLDAVVNEVSRHCLFLSFGIFRSTNTDVTFNGFFIPKGTVICSVPGLNHKDPTYWNNPEEFDPTRFLDSDGKFVQTHEGFQPFGIGKRQCLGEQFARMELFLILAALLQKFSFHPPGEEKLDMTPQQLPQINMPNRKLKFKIKLRQ